MNRASSSGFSPSRCSFSMTWSYEFAVSLTNAGICERPASLEARNRRAPKFRIQRFSRSGWRRTEIACRTSFGDRRGELLQGLRIELLARLRWILVNGVDGQLQRGALPVRALSIRDPADLRQGLKVKAHCALPESTRSR